MSYGYTSDDMLASVATNGGAAATFDCDGYDRLYRLNQSGTILRYAGDELVAEENASATILKRYVPVGVDEPLIWYDGAAMGDRRWFYQDERGSVIATAGSFAASMPASLDGGVASATAGSVDRPPLVGGF